MNDAQAVRLTLALRKLALAVAEVDEMELAKVKEAHGLDDDTIERLKAKASRGDPDAAARLEPLTVAEINRTLRHPGSR